MSISTKLEGDDLKINIVDLLSGLSGEQELQLIEQLSCSDAVIKHVADQITEGLTEGGYSGFESCGWEPSTALDIAKHQVAINCSSMTTSHIENLQRHLKRIESSRNEYQNKLYELRDKYKDWS